MGKFGRENVSSKLLCDFLNTFPAPVYVNLRQYTHVISRIVLIYQETTGVFFRLKGLAIYSNDYFNKDFTFYNQILR